MEKKKQKFNKLKILLFSILLVFSIFFSSFSFNLTTYAASTIETYTNVLEDLKTDSEFNELDYPEDLTTLKISVIKIAESANSELIIYIYKPYTTILPGTISNSYDPSSINININNAGFSNYKLSVINRSGVFLKCKVNNYKCLTSILTRTYEISSVFRYGESEDLIFGGITTYASTINPDLPGITTETAYTVAEKYVVTTKNGVKKYARIPIEVIQITDKFVGFSRYWGGFELLKPSIDCDVHFVAFNTDKQIDKLLRAKVYYTSQYYKCEHYLIEVPYKDYTYGDKIDNEVELKSGQSDSFEGAGWWSKKYSWNLINTSAEFLNTLENNEVFEKNGFDSEAEKELENSSKTTISGMKWVLNYAATEYKKTEGLKILTTEKTIVGDVSILELTFETDGTEYTMGVVDNKTTGSSEPVIRVGSSSPFDPLAAFWNWLKNFFKNFKTVVIVIILVILFILFFPAIVSLLALLINFITPVFKLILNILLFILKLSLTIINLFRGKL